MRIRTVLGQDKTFFLLHTFRYFGSIFRRSAIWYMYILLNGICSEQSIYFISNVFERNYQMNIQTNHSTGWSVTAIKTRFII